MRPGTARIRRAAQESPIKKVSQREMQREDERKIDGISYLTVNRTVMLCPLPSKPEPRSGS